jgi:hypothetical protein
VWRAAARTPNLLSKLFGREAGKEKIKAATMDRLRDGNSMVISANETDNA